MGSMAFGHKRAFGQTFPVGQGDFAAVRRVQLHAVGRVIPTWPRNPDALKAGEKVSRSPLYTLYSVKKCLIPSV